MASKVLFIMKLIRRPSLALEPVLAINIYLIRYMHIPRYIYAFRLITIDIYNYRWQWIRTIEIIGWIILCKAQDQQRASTPTFLLSRDFSSSSPYFLYHIFLKRSIFNSIFSNIV